MTKWWTAPEMWPGETAVCIGGGPSLTQEQVDFVRGKARVIAINDAYLLAPWADVLYFCDDRWWGWHKDRPEYRAFAGLKVKMYESERVHQIEPGVKMMQNLGTRGLSPIRRGLMTGQNSGYQAIGLAVHFGVKRIILIGYDMRFDGKRSHWHGGHPRPTAPNTYSGTMLPNFPSMVDGLKERGVEVINCTPGSALTVFPMMDLACALSASSVACPTTAPTPSMPVSGPPDTISSAA